MANAMAPAARHMWKQSRKTPQLKSRDWVVNQPEQLEAVLHILKEIQEEFNKDSGGKKPSA